jgi:SdpI/YfhL protein family
VTAHLIESTSAFKFTIASGILSVGLVTLLVSLPLIYRKVPMNAFYGIRIRASFQSKQRWYDINAQGGKLFAKWSALIIVAGLIGFIVPTDLFLFYAPAAPIGVLLAILMPLIQVVRWARSTQ